MTKHEKAAKTVELLQDASKRAASLKKSYKWHKSQPSDALVFWIYDSKPETLRSILLKYKQAKKVEARILKNLKNQISKL